MQKIIRTVRVMRAREPKAMITAVGCAQLTNSTILSSIPRCEGKYVNVEFFNLDKNVSPEDILLQYQSRDLTPDPYAQAAVNEAEPTFAEKYPNLTCWEDERYNLCYLFFTVIDGSRVVLAQQTDSLHGGGLPGGYCWYCGVHREKSEQSALKNSNASG